MRRFTVVNQEKPDQAIGEGVVWSDGSVAVQWNGWQRFTQYREGKQFFYDGLNHLMQSAEHHFPDGTLRLYWIDPYWDAPYPITRSVNGEPYVDATQFPSHRLHDGWGKPNGVMDSKSTPLHVGQQVKLLTGGYEGCGDVGEIFALTINEHGKLRIGLAGVNCCNMADVDLAEIEAIETTVEQTRDRYGGQKPSWGFTPTITISSD